MTYTSTISSQGQVVIPIKLRKALSIPPGSKIQMNLNPHPKYPTITIQPKITNWVDRVAGIAKGMYGDVDKYIKNERDSWDRSKPWP